MNTIIKYSLILLLNILFGQNINAQLYDNTFNGTGVWNRQVENSSNILNSIILQTDGKILYAGSTADNIGSDPSHFTIGRININGTNDNSFDTDGAVEYTFNTGTYNEAYSMCYLNSKIYAVGVNASSTVADNLLIKLNDDGSLDNTFNGTGEISPIVESASNSSFVVVKTNNNKLVVLGASAAVAHTYHLSGFKVDENASYDNSFGNSGTSIINITPGLISADQIEVLSDNSILFILGYNLIKMKANGHLDSTFGTNGQLSLNSISTNSMQGITVQKDGKIILCNGDVNQHFSVYRLNQNGSPDLTFGTNGKTLVTFSGISSGANTVVVDTSSVTGKIFVAGFSAYNGGTISFAALARISSVDGSIEAQAEFQPNNLNTDVKDILLQTDGKIIIAGNSNGYSTDDFIVTRINSNFTTIVATDIKESLSTLTTGINIFPNPASQNINIHSAYTIENIKIIDILGNEVMNLTSSGNTQLDISSLPKGLYNFVIKTDKGTGNKKVSVQ